LDLSRNWTWQYSYAHLVHPEANELGNINRQTASISYNRPLAQISGNLNATLLWGRNHKLSLASNQNSYLLESVLNFKTRNYFFQRFELVDKDELFADLASPPSPAPDRSFSIGAFTLAGVRALVHTPTVEIGLGADVTFYATP